MKTYKKLVSFPENEAEIIPSSYPGAVQSLTLIPFILSQPQFPLSPFGLIHIRSEFTIFTKLTIKDLLDFKVFISGHRDTEKGIEFDVITQAFNFMGIKVWELVEVLLSRKKGRSSKKPPPNKLDGIHTFFGNFFPLKFNAINPLLKNRITFSNKNSNYFCSR